MLSKQELGRQIIHIVIGLVTAFLVYVDVLSALSIFFLIIIGFLASFISRYVSFPPFSWFLKHFEREEMMKKFPGKGLVFFFIGVLLCVKLFEKDIALAAIMVLALGDSVSHIVGAQYGKIKNIFNWRGHKLFEGTVMGSLCGFVGALLFVPIPEALLGSFGAMFAEVIEIEFNQNTLDDNLVVPLVAGTIMLLVRSYL
jgi:phytol kinase